MAHLVFQTAFPGDLFLAIPLLKRIKEWEPETRLVLACRPGLGEYFLKSGLVDEVVEIDKRSGAGRARAQSRLRAEVWDLIFVPHQSPRTALWMTRLRASRGKIGFKLWWNAWFFNQRVVKPMHLPDALRQLSLMAPVDTRLAEMFGDDEVQALRNVGEFNSLRQAPFVDYRAPKIPEWASMRVAASSSARAAAKASRVGKLIFLAPGSVWATKRWTETGYEEVARTFLKRGYAVELVGSGAEKELCERIAHRVPGVVNRAGQTSLAGLVDLLSEGTALVCNDSGAMHAAAAAGVPTVSIFGPTVLAQGFRPWQNQAVVVQRALICRPCGRHGSQVCPIGTHACMVEIGSPEVLRALDSLLRRLAPS